MMNLGFEKRLDEAFGMIRGLNSDAIIVVAGLYNPLSIVTDEATEFENIMEDWNNEIEVRTCYGWKIMFRSCS